MNRQRKRRYADISEQRRRRYADIGEQTEKEEVCRHRWPDREGGGMQT